MSRRTDPTAEMWRRIMKEDSADAKKKTRKRKKGADTMSNTQPSNPIPDPYIFSMGTPLMFFNGRLFQPANNQDSGLTNNYVEFSDTRHELQEIASPKDLEDLYFKHNSQASEEFQQRYIRTTLQKELRSKNLLEDELKNNKILSFIVNDVLPVITEERLEEDISTILTDEEHETQRRKASRARSGPRQETSAPQARRTVEHQEIPRGLLAEVRRMKREFLAKLDAEYAPFERTNPNHRRNDQNSRESNLVSRINELLSPSRPDYISRMISDERYELLQDNSILNNNVLFSNIMTIGERMYDLVSLPEFIGYFKDKMKPELYHKLERMSASVDPDELNHAVREGILDIDKKCRSRIRNKLRESKVKINGEYYIPFYREDSPAFRNNLLTRYNKLVEKKLKAEAFDRYEQQTTDIYELAEEKKRLEHIAKMSNYERKGAGFKIVHGDYYAFVTTPKYALRSPHVSSPKRYVVFEPATIGVRVRHISGRNFEFSDPMIMHSYTHPFLGEASAYKTICLGDRGFSAAHSAKRLSPERAVLALLDQGKKTLMMGYNSGNNPHKSLQKESWPESRWKTKEEVERKGIVCLNERL